MNETMEQPAVTDRVLLLAGIFGALGVAIGAFGAHGLDGFLMDRLRDSAKVDQRISQFDVAARYHLVHAVAILAISSLSMDSVKRTRIAIGFSIGIVFFSGSLYLLVLLEVPILGAVTPIGGVAWIVSWIMLAVAAVRK